MKKLFLAVLLMSAGLARAQAGLGTVNGQCALGDIVPVVQGLTATAPFSGSYPQCTVTVYLTGTITKANIYATSGKGALGNPFTANADGSYLFFAAVNAGLDVVTSAGTPYSMPNPFTLTGVVPADALLSTSVISSANYATFNAAVADCPVSGTLQIVSVLPTTTLAVPATCSLQSFDGGEITGNGQTLTIPGPLSGGTWQIFGTGLTVAGLSFDRPEWWGASGATLGNVYTAITSLNASTGGKVKMELGVYNSGMTEGVSTALAVPYLELEGAGRPGFNSATAPTAMSGGTIVQGPLLFKQGSKFLKAQHFGVDVGSTYINTFNGGVAEDGFEIANAGQVIGATPVQGVIADDISCLGYSLSAAVHCFLAENVTESSLTNLDLRLNQHGLVIKGTHVKADGVYSSGHGTDSVIVKSDSYAVSGAVDLIHIHIVPLATPGDTAGLFLQASGAPLNYVNLSDSTILQTGNWGVLLSGASAPNSVNDITIKGVSFDYPGGAGAGVDCIQLQSYVSVVQVVGINCLNYGAGVIPNAPNSSQQNFSVADSSFINLAGNAIELYGRSTVTGNNIVGIGGNAIQSDSGTLLESNNQLASISGTAYASSGGTVLHNPMAASLVTTAAATDNVSIPGMVSTGHCSLTPTNAAASGAASVPYISNKTGNQITVTHAVTANMNYDVLCVQY